MGDVLLLPLFAVVAGVISFSSPCSLPLVPGYLSYISAIPVAHLGERESRATTLRASLLFVGGFTTVFTLLGLGASALGSLLLRNQDELTRWFGLVIVLLGLSTVGILKVPGLHRERRVDLARIPRGPAWAFPLGMGFAAGWTPCVGPVLATILTTASLSGSALWGAVLLGLYSVGLGVPFVLLAVGYRRATGSLAWLRRRSRAVEVTGGLLLVAVGLLFMSGRWVEMFRPLQRWFAETGWPPV